MSTRLLRVTAAAAALVSAAACASGPPAAPDASDGYANFLVGRIANLREDHQAASDRYYYALATAPSDPQLLQEAVAASLAAGEIDRARHIAEMADARRADAPLAYLVRSVDALGAGRFGLAADKLAHVRGSTAEELCERVLSTWAKAGDGRAGDAAADLARLDAPPPFSGIYLYQRALALDFAGYDEAALASYAEAAGAGAWLPEAALRHADLLVRRGAPDEAARLLRELAALASNPEIEAALARIEAGRAPAISPLTPARGAAIGLYSLGALYLRDADTLSGLAAFSLALMLDSELDAARLDYAEAQIALKHYASASAMLAQVRSDSPYAANAAMSEAWALIDQGRGAEGLARAEAAAGADDNARTRRMLAQIYTRLDRPFEAEAIYTELIDAAGEAGADWRILFARGAAREQSGRWSEAEADLLRALELAPDRAEVLNFLGYSWVDRGLRLDEGLALIERAAELRPQSGAIIDSLGWAFYRLGDYEQALSHLERAVVLTPADPVLNDHLGDVYWRLGRRIEARFQWRRALGFAPSSADQEAILRKLEVGLDPIQAADAAAR